MLTRLGRAILKDGRFTLQCYTPDKSDFLPEKSVTHYLEFFYV